MKLSEAAQQLSREVGVLREEVDSLRSTSQALEAEKREDVSPFMLPCLGKAYSEKCSILGALSHFFPLRVPKKSRLFPEQPVPRVIRVSHDIAPSSSPSPLYRRSALEPALQAVQTELISLTTEFSSLQSRFDGQASSNPTLTLVCLLSQAFNPPPS